MRTAATTTGAAAAAAGADVTGLAMRRWEVLRPHVEDGVPLSRAAQDVGTALRTAQRWLTAFRTGGLPALIQQTRADAGRPRTRAALVEVVQGLALTRYLPAQSAGTWGLACAGRCS